MHGLAKVCLLATLYESTSQWTRPAHSIAIRSFTWYAWLAHLLDRRQQCVTTGCLNRLACMTSESPFVHAPPDFLGSPESKTQVGDSRDPGIAVSLSTFHANCNFRFVWASLLSSKLSSLSCSRQVLLHGPRFAGCRTGSIMMLKLKSITKFERAMMVCSISHTYLDCVMHPGNVTQAVANQPSTRMRRQRLSRSSEDVAQTRNTWAGRTQLAALNRVVSWELGTP